MAFISLYSTIPKKNAIFLLSYDYNKGIPASYKYR